MRLASLKLPNHFYTFLDQDPHFSHNMSTFLRSKDCLVITTSNVCLRVLHLFKLGLMVMVKIGFTLKLGFRCFVWMDSVRVRW